MHSRAPVLWRSTTSSQLPWWHLFGSDSFVSDLDFRSSILELLILNMYQGLSQSDPPLASNNTLSKLPHASNGDPHCTRKPNLHQQSVLLFLTLVSVLSLSDINHPFIGRRRDRASPQLARQCISIERFSIELTLQHLNIRLLPFF